MRSDSAAPSAGKLRKIEELCTAAGVHTRPRLVGGVWVVPLLSWYHSTWDREPDVDGARPVEKVRQPFAALGLEDSEIDSCLK